MNTDGMSVTNPAINGNIGNLQSILQLQMVKNFSTGNFMMDSIIQLMVITFVGYLMGKIKDLSNYGQRLTGFLYIYFWNLFHRCFLKNNLVHKSVTVQYITPTKQINELYKAVHWYLINKNDKLAENIAYDYVYDKKITESDDTSTYHVSKIPKNNNVSSIKFKNYDIYYTSNTSLITIYNDKDRQRENYSIQLSVDMDASLSTKSDLLEEFCLHCMNSYAASLKGTVWKQMVYTNKGSTWESKLSNNSRRLDTVILKNKLKNEIKKDIDIFLNSREWYETRDIPYTRGYLYYGLPGTGKTSMIKAISLYCKRHIHTMNLASVESDEQLTELMKNIKWNETVLVFEDIDAMNDIIRSRKSKNKEEKGEEKHSSSRSRSRSRSRSPKNERHTVKEEEPKRSKLTLSGLLNAIDGVCECNGRIIIMTTNYPEVLDEALIRPGRCDRKYLFDNCDKSQIVDLYEMFFNEKIDEKQFDFDAKNYSPAHITSTFLRYRNEPEKALLHLDDDANKAEEFNINN